VATDAQRVPKSYPAICVGCGISFETHLRTRVYCCDDCRALTVVARTAAGICVCGEQRAWDSRETRDEYVARHKPCRRAALDRDGRANECGCAHCTRERRAAGRPDPVRLAKPSKRRSGYQKHREEVLVRDNYMCQICSLPTDPDAHPMDDRYPVLDHHESVATGGDDQIGNLRTAHRWCNEVRSDGLWVSDREIRVAAHERFAAPV
jgi:hypothetical protein